MWYGKGPGVDRTGDAFRHANLAGTAPLGGVLVLMGDDHTCESSTTAHQSEFALVDAMIPVVNPAGVAELLEFGLLGLRAVPLQRLLGRPEVRARHGQHRGLDRARPCAHRDSHARRLRAAAGRAQHPLARHAARPGGAAAPLQAGRGARVRPHQLVRPAGVRQPARAARHRLDRQVLSGPAPGARRSRHRPRDGRAAWPARAQARPGLAARAASACARSPPASSRSSWSRRSAP